MSCRVIENRQVVTDSESVTIRGQRVIAIMIRRVNVVSRESGSGRHSRMPLRIPGWRGPGQETVAERKCRFAEPSTPPRPLLSEILPSFTMQPVDI